MFKPVAELLTILIKDCILYTATEFYFLKQAEKRFVYKASPRVS